MHKMTVASLALLLGACAQPDEMKAPDAVPVIAVTTSVKSSFYDCTRHVLALEKIIGRKVPEINYFPVRIIAPNSSVTMDHNLSRLNIYVDGDGKIASAKCG